MAASVIGFKIPEADLHRKSPRILAISIISSILLVGIGLHVPFFREKTVERKIKTPPVIIHLENIPETRHIIRAPAPRLAIPLEVDDEFMPDDITIESTELNLNETVELPPVIEIHQEPAAGDVEEEIFELFAVEEQPVRIKEVMPDYPETVQRAGIEGTVFIRALVDKTGAVVKAEVLKGPDKLHEAALEAARKTKFKPAKQNDMPVSCWVQMSFRFELE